MPDTTDSDISMNVEAFESLSVCWLAMDEELRELDILKN